MNPCFRDLIVVVTVIFLGLFSSLHAQFGIIQTFSSSNNLNPAITPLVGDVDGDGQTEIVALNNNLNIIYVHDGATGVIENSFSVVHQGSNCPCNQPGGGIAMADVDSDGNVELLLTANNQFIYCYRINTGTLVWTSQVQVFDNEDGPFIADFNQDGNPEVYAGNQIFDGATGNFLTQAPNGASDPIGRVDCGTCFGSYDVWDPALPIAVDALPDAACADCQGLELVTGNTVYAISAGFTSMTPVVSIAGAGYSDGTASVGDIDADGDLDCISPVRQGNVWGVVAWDLQTGMVLGFYPMPSNTWAGRANLADLDCDPGLEITVVSNDIIYFLDNDLSLLNSFSISDNSRSTSVTAFDFDGDGVEEIVYRGETNLHILEGITGNSLATIACGSPTAVEFPVVADVDNNGDAEIVTICGSLSSYNIGQLGIFDSNGSAWESSRSVMNQHGYYNVNINDDLSVPTVQMAHHLVPGLNGFMNQAASLNPSIPPYPGYDAEITIDNTVLGASGWTVTVTICNTNLAGQTLPAATPIAFFDDDPTSIAANTLFSDATILPLAPGQCETRSFTFSGSCSSLYAIVNENGDGNPSLPFSIVSDFPFAISGECDFTNNLDAEIRNCDCDSALHRTQTQGGWGTSCNGNNPGCYRDANFAAAFSNGLIVGCSSGFTLEFTSSNAIQDFLPCGGSPDVLDVSATDPSCNDIRNVLASQVIAISLSLGFDANDPNFGASAIYLGDMIIASGPFAGQTVTSVVAIANEVLGGCSTAYSPSYINDVITQFNQAFVDGNSTSGFLICPPSGNINPPTPTNPTTGLTISPNPGNGVFSLILTEVPVQDNSKGRLTIYDPIGRAIHNQSLMVVGGESKIDFDLSNVSPGRYLAQILIGDILYTQWVQKL